MGDAVLEEVRPAAPEAGPCDPAPAAPRRPRRVLLVEDSALVAMQVEHMLLAAGCEVVGPAARVAAALKLAREEPIEAAVVDIETLESSQYLLRLASGTRLSSGPSYRDRVRQAFRLTGPTR